MKRYKLTLAYDGTGFCGWQRQSGMPSVQAAVEHALGRIYGRGIAVTGSGRTDEGVHAYGQVAHFDAPDTIEPAKLTGALNFYLPELVRALDCVEVSEHFHARKSAKLKTYVYDMYAAPFDSPFLVNRAARLPGHCDTEKMKAAAGIFLGQHDFCAFRCKGSSAKTTVRTITACEIYEVELAGGRGIRLTVTADGFLYKMVRILAGTLMRVGEDKLTEQDIRRLLDEGKEWEQKFPAPPYGLYLHHVLYTDNPK